MARTEVTYATVFSIALLHFPFSNASSTAHKKGFVTTPGVPATAFQNLNGVANWLYNYNVIPSSKAEVDFLNSNDMEFVAMFGGTYAQLEMEWGTVECLPNIAFNAHYITNDTKRDAFDQ